MSTKSQEHLDPVDRALTTWIINFILDRKTQEEIAKDVDDGILDIKVVEEIFSWRYVEDLRQGNLASDQNYFNRFSQISDDQLKTILVRYFRQKDRNDLVKVINENANKMDELQISFLWKYVLEKEESIDAVPSTSDSSRDTNERIEESSKAEKEGKGMPKKSDNSKMSSIIVVINPDKQVPVERKQTPSVGTKRRKQTTKKSVNPETSPGSLLRISPDGGQNVDENKESPNVETKRKRLTKKDDNSETSSKILSKSPDEEIVVGRKDSPEVGTKGKRIAKKGGKKGTKKGEKKGTKKSDEEKTTEKKVEKPKKVRAATKKMAADVVESKNARAVGFRVDDGNKVVELIEERASSKGDNEMLEKASTDLCVSTDLGSRRNGSEELLSATCQEDSSKNAESSGDKRKIILKFSKKKMKDSIEIINERVSKDMNSPVESTFSTKGKRVEENNETGNKENVIEKEEAGFAEKNDCNVSSETRKDEGFEESSQKSRSNETANVTSLIGEEQGLRGNQKQDVLDVQEYDDIGLQLDTSTPKKLDSDDNMIEVKEEPKNDCSLRVVIYYPGRQDQNKNVNTEKDLNGELQVTNNEEAAAAVAAAAAVVAAVSNPTDTTELTNVKMENIAKSPEELDSTKEKIVVKVKKSKYKKRYDRSLDRRRRSKSKQNKREELLKREQKIRNTMDALRDQIIRLMNDLRHLETRSSTSSTDDNSETESSSTINEEISGEELPSIDYEDSEEESLYSITSGDNIKLISDSAEHQSDPSHVSSENDSSKEGSESDYTICTSSNYNESMCNEYTEQDSTKDDDA